MKLRKLRFVHGSTFLIFFLLISTSGVAQGNLDVWGTVPSPSRGNKASDLKGIAAVASDDIWAVGEFNPSFGRRIGFGSGPGRIQPGWRHAGGDRNRHQLNRCVPGFQ